MKIPEPLTHDQVDQLLKNLTKENRDILITHHMTYAIKIANNFIKYSFDIDDLYGIAFESLTKATYQYDPNYGVSYYSFMKNEIYHTLQNYTMKENKYRSQVFIPDQIVDDDGDDLEPSYLVCHDNQYEAVLCKNCIEHTLQKYSINHRLIIFMILSGYNQMMISTYLKVSQGYISKILHKFREEFKKNYM